MHKSRKRKSRESSPQEKVLVTLSTAEKFTFHGIISFVHITYEDQRERSPQENVLVTHEGEIHIYCACCDDHTQKTNEKVLSKDRGSEQCQIMDRATALVGGTGRCGRLNHWQSSSGRLNAAAVYAT